jgi:taurine dioxygenase
MARLTFKNIKEGFGAEVRGLDPQGEFDDGLCNELRRAFDERGVLLFPGIDITYAQQDKLCRMLIRDEGPGMASKKPDPLLISNKEPGGYAPHGRLMFHADMLWHPKPFDVLSLYGVKVEPGSATTSLASGVNGWATLPKNLRARVEGLEAVHMTGQVYSRGGDDLLKPEREKEQSAVKPIKYRHPRTGKTVLLVSQQMTREIVGMPPDESEELLQALFSHLYSPENVYEHHWRTGDLVVFDNIAMQHARGNVVANGPTRTLRKVIAPIPTAHAEVPKYAAAQ